MLNLFYNNVSDITYAGITYSLFIYSVKPISGILFGIAFWRMSKSVDHVQIKNYMIIGHIWHDVNVYFKSTNWSNPSTIPSIWACHCCIFWLTCIPIFGWCIYLSNFCISGGSIRKYIQNYAKQLIFFERNRLIGDVQAKTKTLENATGIESSCQRAGHKVIYKNCNTRRKKITVKSSNSKFLFLDTLVHKIFYNKQVDNIEYSVM